MKKTEKMDIIKMFKNNEEALKALSQIKSNQDVMDFIRRAAGDEALGSLAAEKFKDLEKESEEQLNIWLKHSPKCKPILKKLYLAQYNKLEVPQFPKEIDSLGESH